MDAAAQSTAITIDKSRLANITMQPQTITMHGVGRIRSFEELQWQLQCYINLVLFPEIFKQPMWNVSNAPIVNWLSFPRIHQYSSAGFAHCHTNKFVHSDNIQAFTYSSLTTQFPIHFTIDASLKAHNW